jgi:hypothetical protein
MKSTNLPTIGGAEHNSKQPSVRSRMPRRGSLDSLTSLHDASSLSTHSLTSPLNLYSHHQHASANSLTSCSGDYDAESSSRRPNSGTRKSIAFPSRMLRRGSLDSQTLLNSSSLSTRTRLPLPPTLYSHDKDASPTNSLKSCLADQGTTSTSPQLNKNSGMKKSVSFHKLTIREYSQVPEINPSVSSGPPIGLGWDVELEGSVDIAKYEEFRPPRRSRSELNIPASVRKTMLCQEHSLAEVNRATKLSNIARKQRKSTTSQQDMEKAHLFLESAGRKLKRWVQGKSTRTEQEELWTKAQMSQKEWELGDVSRLSDDDKSIRTEQEELWTMARMKQKECELDVSRSNCDFQIGLQLEEDPPSF